MLSVSPEVTLSVIINTSVIGGRHRSHDLGPSVKHSLMVCLTSDTPDGRPASLWPWRLLSYIITTLSPSPGVSLHRERGCVCMHISRTQ